MFTVDYYEDERGRRPVEEFIDGLNPKMRAKVFGRLMLLEEHGKGSGCRFHATWRMVSSSLGRRRGGNITRVLYFFVVGERAILTHGFVKKTQRTPPREIERAKKARDDWRQRNE